MLSGVRRGALRRAICAIGLWLTALGLTACTTSAPDAERQPETSTGPYYIGEDARVECAPFARALSGLPLYGAAADWWEKAAGRYDRSEVPRIGSLLVFRRSSRLAAGHVAVISHLVADREVLVTQANWVRGRVTADTPVIDVSPANDWTEVRVWWPPSGQMGITRYPTYGFILPDHPRTRDTLIAEAPRAFAIAATDR